MARIFEEQQFADDFSSHPVWRLSCYSPSRGLPVQLCDGTDCSQEEARMLYYSSPGANLDDINRRFQSLEHEALSRFERIKQHQAEATEYINLVHNSGYNKYTGSGVAPESDFFTFLDRKVRSGNAFRAPISAGAGVANAFAQPAQNPMQPVSAFGRPTQSAFGPPAQSSGNFAAVPRTPSILPPPFSQTGFGGNPSLQQTQSVFGPSSQRRDVFGTNSVQSVQSAFGTAVVSSNPATSSFGANQNGGLGAIMSETHQNGPQGSAFSAPISTSSPAQQGSFLAPAFGPVPNTPGYNIGGQTQSAFGSPNQTAPASSTGMVSAFSDPRTTGYNSQAGQKFGNLNGISGGLGSIGQQNQTSRSVPGGLSSFVGGSLSQSPQASTQQSASLPSSNSPNVWEVLKSLKKKYSGSVRQETPEEAARLLRMQGPYTASDLEAFKADTFEPGKIPLRAPTQAICRGVL